MKTETSITLESIDALITAANKALTDNDYAAVSKNAAAITEAVKGYNAALIKADYKRLLGTEVPIVEAIKQLTVPTIAVSKKMDKNKNERFERSKAEAFIDLMDLEDQGADEGYGIVTVNGQWRYLVEELNYQLSCRRAEEIEAKNKSDVAEKHIRSEKAKAAGECLVTVEATKGKKAPTEPKKDPVSNESLRENLQLIVDSIVFIDDGKGKNKLRVDKKDVRAMLIWSSAHGKQKCSVRTATHRLAVRYVAEIIHTKLEGCGYTVEFEGMAKA